MVDNPGRTALMTSTSGFALSPIGQPEIRGDRREDSGLTAAATDNEFRVSCWLGWWRRMAGVVPVYGDLRRIHGRLADTRPERMDLPQVSNCLYRATPGRFALGRRDLGSPTPSDAPRRVACRR
jgi:hypothetical protein